MTQSMARPPSRSPSTPNIGAPSVPRKCSEPKTVSRSTEPVCTSTYQPRMTVSISNAHEVKRSAGHWKRKLLTRKGASVRDGRGVVTAWARIAGGRAPPPSWRLRLRAEATDDRDRGDVLAREAPEIVRETEHGVARLPLASPAAELQVHLVEHAQAGGADRGAEALQAAVHLAGHPARPILQ